MTDEEIKNLKEKIDSGQGTPEEKLLLIKEITANISALRQDIVTLKKDADLENIRKSVNKL